MVAMANPSETAGSTVGGPFDSIERVSAAEEVRRQILNAIEGGDYGPGDRLPSERALCEMLGVSRVSVREAIAGLEAMGLVQVRHGSGCFVVPDIAEQVSQALHDRVRTHRGRVLDLYKVRGALDQLAAQEAVRNAQDLDLQRLRTAHEAFAAAASAPAPDIQRLVELDVQFHDAVAAAADSELIRELLMQLAGHFGDSRRAILSSPGRPTLSAEQHRIIVDAIVGRDEDSATSAAEAHIDDICQWIASQEW